METRENYDYAGKLLLQERIHINHVIHDKPKNSIEKLKGNIIESVTLEKFHHQNLYKKSFDLTEKRHIRKFEVPISKNKVIKSATNITDKNKWVINISSRQLIHIKTDLLAKGLNFSITSKTLHKDTIATT